MPSSRFRLPLRTSPPLAVRCGGEAAPAGMLPLLARRKEDRLGAPGTASSSSRMPASDVRLPAVVGREGEGLVEHRRRLPQPRATRTQAAHLAVTTYTTDKKQWTLQKTQNLYTVRLTGCRGAAQGGHQVRGGGKRVGCWVWPTRCVVALAGAIQRKAAEPAGQLLHLTRTQLLLCLLLLLVRWGGGATGRTGQWRGGQAAQDVVPCRGGRAEDTQGGGQAVPSVAGAGGLGDAHLREARGGRQGASRPWAISRV